MSMTLVLAFTLQQLQVTPFPAEAHQPVTVRVEGSAGPAAGVEILVDLPDGERQSIGSTDAAGEVRFVPAVSGLHCYRAEVDGVRLLAPHHVVPVRRRWLYALACVPLGFLLLWRALRPARRSALGPSAGGKVTSGPSRPSP